ncbi:hypothetical protein LCGC14_2572630 [marine sediment metagenome]|uniref:Uncharacterized protein n=1 Tax=marine sediment metagenome TaxID=412755 RepID=A0A0F9CT09_9ZZZZ
MKISRDYSVWKCTVVDNARPTLAHVEIKAAPGSGMDFNPPDDDGYVDGTAAATDGFMLAVVPIKLFQPGEGFDYARSGFIDPDIPGIVDPVVFVAALKIAKKRRENDLIIDLAKSDLAGLRDGSWLPRQNDPTLTGNFPDWRPIVPKRQRAQDREHQLMSMNFQPQFLVTVANAIGCQVALSGRGSGNGSGLPRVIFGSPNDDGSSNDPIVVEPSTAEIGSTFDPPFGLIMPVHYTLTDPNRFYNQD